MGMVKGARPEVLKRIAVRCADRRDTDFNGFFTSGSTLVPVPASAPARAPDTLWPGLSIAEALLAQGLGRDVQKLLVRTVRVPRAHEQPAVDRPRVDELAASCSSISSTPRDGKFVAHAEPPALHAAPIDDSKI
jgi:hypothetical protein